MCPRDRVLAFSARRNSTGSAVRFTDDVEHEVVPKRKASLAKSKPNAKIAASKKLGGGLSRFDWPGSRSSPNVEWDGHGGEHGGRERVHRRQRNTSLCLGRIVGVMGRCCTRRSMRVQLPAPRASSAARRGHWHPWTEQRAIASPLAFSNFAEKGQLS